MKTMKYKILRITVQILAILLFIVNAAAFFVFISSSLDRIEQNLVPKPLIFFSDFSLYITGLNVFFSLISLCSITSKTKLLMNMCGNLLYIQMCCSVLSTVYFQLFYKNDVLSSLTDGMIKNNGGFISLMRSVNIMPVNGSMIEGFRRYIDSVVLMFSISQISSTFLGYMMIKAFKYVLSIPFEKKVELPGIKQASKLGNINMNLNQVQPIPVKGHWDIK